MRDEGEGHHARVVGPSVTDWWVGDRGTGQPRDAPGLGFLVPDAPFFVGAPPSSLAPMDPRVRTSGRSEARAGCAAGRGIRPHPPSTPLDQSGSEYLEGEIVLVYEG